MAREIIAGARQVFLVADHTKFSRSPVVRLGSIADVSALFTDRAPAPAFRSLMAGHGVRLYVSEAAEEGAHTSSGDVAIRA